MTSFLWKRQAEMALLQLRHAGIVQSRNYGKAADARYPGPETLPALPEKLGGGKGQGLLISFRSPQRLSCTHEILNVHACTRFLDLPDADLTFYCVESDSPLAPLLLWDAAHQLPVGRSITLLDDELDSHYLERKYFRNSFRIERIDGGVAFHKLTPLPVERDRGLGRWSFCIPVGPDDANILNAVVKRILELDLPEKEILLCGRPGQNFKYWDLVRIVGEDIAAPPVRIGAKKNRLAQEARFENLCILHDRVFLPLGFGKAVSQFGDLFPFATLQSLYFDDKWNLVPRRYVDFNQSIDDKPKVFGLAREGSHFSEFSPDTLAIMEGKGYRYASPLRHSGRNFVTGGLYLAKRSLWLTFPQDEYLYWTEFEDVEQGLRASESGVPSRINPFAISQSIISRPLMSMAGAVECEFADGKVGLYRPMTEPLPIPRKPLLRTSRLQAVQAFRKFAAKYAPEFTPSSDTSRLRISSDRLKAITEILHHIRVPFRIGAYREFVSDYERWLVLDQIPYGSKARLEKCFLKSKRALLGYLLLLLLNQLALRRKQYLWMEDMHDFFQSRSILLRCGSMLSAILLGFQNQKAFYFPCGLKGRYRMLMESTPFVDYLEIRKP